MEQFVKLTQITGRKVENEEKTATGVKPIYVRPWDIESFSQDEDGVTVVKFNNHECIHVAETAEEIFKMINGKEYHPLTGSISNNNLYDFEITNWNKKDKIFFDDDFWWSKPFKAEWTSRDTFEKLHSNTPYYGYAIVFGNGDIWE